MKDPTAVPTDEFERILGEAVHGPLTAQPAYVPVPLDSLVPGKVPGFQVFIQVDGRFIPFQAAVEAFEPAARARLQELHHATVYVRAEDHASYQSYLESNLRDIVADSRIPAASKAHVVYQATQGIMREILADTEDPMLVERSQQAASAAVELILHGRGSFLNLFSSCSFDYRTYTHSVHVCIFSVALAHQMGIPEADLPELGTAVLLHDIGKTRIDSRILNKTGPLTAQEWDIMRQHPRWGVEIVSGCPGVTPRIRDIILHHHEKLDGSGYPDGLTAKDLGPEVRLVTICDIFDAVTTNRSYKRALATFDCLNLMEREMRAQIDFDILVELLLLLRGEH